MNNNYVIFISLYFKDNQFKFIFLKIKLNACRLNKNDWVVSIQYSILLGRRVNFQILELSEKSLKESTLSLNKK